MGEKGPEREKRKPPTEGKDAFGKNLVKENSGKPAYEVAVAFQR